MARRLFLHIGMMKSASTYLQHVCNRQREVLGRSGLAWLLGSSHAQTAAMEVFRGSVHRMPGEEGTWDLLLAELHAHDGDALLSQELLASLPRKRIRPFLEALAVDDIRLVVTARDLSRVIPSRWQETTQNRGTVSWPDYLELVCDDTSQHPLHRRFWRQADAARVLRAWTRVVPADHAYVITVPHEGPRDEIWRRFASVIGADPDLAADAKLANRSLGLVSSTLMLRVNHRVEDLEWPSYRLGFKAGLAKHNLARRSRHEPRLTFPAERWPWVAQRSRRLIAEIEDLGPVVVGDLEDLMPLPPTAEASEYVEPTDEQLLDAAIDGIAELGRQLAAARLDLAAARTRSSGADNPEGDHGDNGSGTAWRPWPVGR